MRSAFRVRTYVPSYHNLGQMSELSASFSWMPAHPPTTLERRRAVLEAALAVVAERGIAGATHREIAKRAGVSLSTTSYFFASIDDLLLETLRYFTEQTRLQIAAVRTAAKGNGLT